MVGWMPSAAPGSAWPAADGGNASTQVSVRLRLDGRPDASRLPDGPEGDLDELQEWLTLLEQE
ncbi:hypothetical protein ADK34_04860 [Streptomyces viridochromogenes]|uniref:Uncharacterized protein n=1 Tax=Streptomyces viridochromogenes TaxID=1938 RepID=A0A0L8LCB0_STRVR|nr:hypothetical protein ADK34_04860 [Streptomyces viridochromogenes]